MFDIWIGDVELTELIIYIAALIMIPVQVFLCLKVKKLMIRLLPMILFLGLTISFIRIAQLYEGWDGFGYVVLAMCTMILLAGSVIGWIIGIIWMIVKKVRMKNVEMR